MSLREDAVAALHAETETWGYKAGIYELLNEVHYQLLDALLDFLDAHTEEWSLREVGSHSGVWTDRQMIQRGPISPEDIGYLVAALRGTTEASDDFDPSTTIILKVPGTVTEVTGGTTEEQ